MLLSLFQRRLSCFYCGRPTSSKWTKTLRQFRCEHCEAVNYLDEVRIFIRSTYGSPAPDISPSKAKSPIHQRLQPSRRYPDTYHLLLMRLSIDRSIRVRRSSAANASRISSLQHKAWLTTRTTRLCLNVKPTSRDNTRQYARTVNLGLNKSSVRPTILQKQIILDDRLSKHT